MPDFRVDGEAMTLADYRRAEAEGRLPRPTVRRHTSDPIITPTLPPAGSGRLSGAAQRAQRKSNR